MKHMLDDTPEKPMETPQADAVPQPEPPQLSPADERFRSCRWRAQTDAGVPDYCTHRDVLPFAGAAGFTADAWCPECAFYKARRNPRKREPRVDYGY